MRCDLWSLLCGKIWREKNETTYSSISKNEMVWSYVEMERNKSSEFSDDESLSNEKNRIPEEKGQEL